MENKCRTCRFWGPECVFNEDILRVFAKCHIPGMSHSGTFTPKDDWCQGHADRPGEPLGTGIARLWMGSPNAWDDDCGVYHDLLVEGGQTVDTDKEWLRVEMLCAKRKPGSGLQKTWRYTKAITGYSVVRLWGLFSA